MPHVLVNSTNCTSLALNKATKTISLLSMQKNLKVEQYVCFMQKVNELLNLYPSKKYVNSICNLLPNLYRDIEIHAFYILMYAYIYNRHSLL